MGRRLCVLAVAVAVLLASQVVPPVGVSPALAAGTVTYTYSVAVRGRVRSDVNQFAASAQATYDDPRGWGLGGSIRFVRVPSGGSFTLWLSQASFVPSFGYPCSSAYSCRIGRNVIINDDRWSFGSPSLSMGVSDYRSMVVNHETGHWLGYPHRTCPGAGQPAFVMQQQSKGGAFLGGCRPNPWPRPEERAALAASRGVPIRTGPVVVVPVGTHYQPLAADFNGDNLADIGLRDTTSGTFYVKHGPAFGDQVVYPWAPGAGYQAFAADLNGDHLADIGLRDVSTGVFYLKHGPAFADQETYRWAPGTSYQPLAADFNGDGIGDIGLRDANNGVFYLKHGPAFADQIVYPWAPGAGSQAFAADFNGDAVADIGLRDIASGGIYIRHGPAFADQGLYRWAPGVSYLPFAADFDGDHLADLGLKDMNNGVFYVKHGPAFADQISYPWAPG